MECWGNFCENELGGFICYFFCISQRSHDVLQFLGQVIHWVGNLSFQNLMCQLFFHWEFQHIKEYKEFYLCLKKSNIQKPFYILISLTHFACMCETRHVTQLVGILMQLACVYGLVPSVCQLIWTFLVLKSTLIPYF